MTIVAPTASNLRNQQELLEHTGLEYMRGVLDGTFPAAPMAMTLGFVLRSVEDGEVTFRGAPNENATNPMGTVHGGWYGTVLDSAMGCAVMTKVPRGSVYTTLEYKINLVRGISTGTQIDCVGIVSHAGRSTAVATAEIRGIDDGMLYATGSTTCIIMKMK